MTETTERARETVEQELENATKSRDKCARELREIRGQLEVARQEEAAGIEASGRAGKKPKASGSVGKLESKAGELERQLPALNRLVNELALERDEHDLADLQREAKEAGEYAAQTLEAKREAIRENERAAARAHGLRDEARNKASAIKKRRRQLDAPPAEPERPRPSWEPMIKGLNG